MKGEEACESGVIYGKPPPESLNYIIPNVGDRRH